MVVGRMSNRFVTRQTAWWSHDNTGDYGSFTCTRCRSLIIEKNRMYSHGSGDAFVYKHYRESKSGLNYGPVAKWKLRTGMIYPHYMELQSSPIYLEVSDGIIFN